MKLREMQIHLDKLIQQAMCFFNEKRWICFEKDGTAESEKQKDHQPGPLASKQNSGHAWSLSKWITDDKRGIISLAHLRADRVIAIASPLQISCGAGSGEEWKLQKKALGEERVHLSSCPLFLFFKSPLPQLCFTELITWNMSFKPN